MVPHGDGINTHFDDWVIIAAGLGHVAEVENVFFADTEFFEEVSHTEDFIHTRGDSINRGSATDFIFKLRSELFATSDDFLTFLAVGVPGIFGFGASFLSESGEGNLTEAVLDDFVAFLEFLLFPIT